MRVEARLHLNFTLLPVLLMIDALSTPDQQQRRIEPFCITCPLSRFSDPVDGDGVDQDIEGASQEAEPSVLMTSPGG